MQSSLGKIGSFSQKIDPMGVFSNNHHCHSTSDPLRNTHVSQVVPGQNSSPVFTSKRCGRVKSSKTDEISVSAGNSEHVNGHQHKIDIGDEKSDLLGQLIISGKLVSDKKNSSSCLKGHNVNPKTAEIEVKLTSKAFVWGSHCLSLDDIVAVSYSDGLRRFTVHSYPFGKRTWVPGSFGNTQRQRKDLHFLASSSDDALQWVSAFAEKICYVNCSPHPLTSCKHQGLIVDARDSPPGRLVTSGSAPVMLVILNPLSGHGCARKLFYNKVQPIFKLAGFKLEVVETTCPRHAQTLACEIDLSLCPDGIICVGGDGIINEVLNGLFARDDPKEGMSVPIGIIPAGSDNSLAWTVLGVRDPISAALAIVKGGLVSSDVFAVEWIQTDTLRAGLTVAYYGFLSDVLELSGKYQKRFGPLRYFVAGALKFLSLPKYNCKVEYLPVSGPASSTGMESKGASQGSSLDGQETHLDVVGRKLDNEGLPRPVSLSSIDSILTTPSQISGEVDTMVAGIDASSEPSDYVRCLDTKSKRVSSARNNLAIKLEEVVHHQLPGPTTPSPRPRTRSKSRTDRGWTGLSSSNGCLRGPWDTTVVVNQDDISCSMCEPGSKWDAGPRWDAEPKWGTENKFEPKGTEAHMPTGMNNRQNIEQKWVVRQGPFLGIMICNHQCRTVQSLRSQVLAPKAEHDDNSLDLLLVHKVGRLQLLRFFILMQFGRHFSLPFVEYTKVKSVKLTPGKNAHQGCGIDGELLSLNGPISISLLPDQCKFIGRPMHHS